MFDREVCPDGIEEIISILSPIIKSRNYAILNSADTANLKREFTRIFPEGRIFMPPRMNTSRELSVF
jgi:hypothetical protein